MKTALLAFSLLLGACYSPEVADCVVACTGSGACAAGQVCGSDGWCAAPDVAGQCAGLSGDASAAASLRVVIEGKGQVQIAPLGVTCNGDDGSADCSYDAAPGDTVTLTPKPKAHQHFVGWSGGDCSAAPCDLAIAAPRSMVTATFEADDQGGGGGD